jgi:hypothetical protein
MEMYSLLTESIIISLLKNRDENHYYLIFKWLYFHIKNYFAFYNYNYIMNTKKNSIGINLCLFKRRIRTYSKTTNSQNVTLYSTGGTEDL